LHFWFSRLDAFEVINLQLRTQVRDNPPRRRAFALPPLHTASTSDLRGSPPPRGGQKPQELPRKPRRLSCRRHITSMLPAPRPLRGRSVQHGPHPFVALGPGGAYSRAGRSWRSGGGPRRQHLNVMWSSAERIR